MSEQIPVTLESIPDSGVLGISVRAWLAILLTVTVCIMSIARIALALAGHAAIASEITTITEPLYSGWLLALGFYFGQKDKR